MSRNAKAIQSKSRKHQVEQVAVGSAFGPTASAAAFTVTSGSSGKQYRVMLTGLATCTCDWGQFRKIGTPCGCSHVVAVYDHLSQKAGRKVSAWKSEEEARRQHRPTIQIGDGLILTARI